MDKLCNNLLETYNTNYLNMEDDEIQLKFEKESKKNKDGNKGRTTLMKLIYNHYNKTKPEPDFIAGPKTLTQHWSEKYKMMIYIFGEFHNTKHDCYKFNKFTKSNTMWIYDFLDQLFQNSVVFIDFYLEFHPKRMKFGNEYTMNHTAKQFYNKKHNLARIHYFDMRKINFHSIFSIAEFLLAFNNSSIKDKKNLLFEDKNIFKNLNILKKYNKEEVVNFIFEEVFKNPMVKKELKRSFLDGEIFDFGYNYIIKAVNKFNKLQDNINIIYDVKTNDIKFNKSYEYVFDALINMTMMTADVYALSRIFKKFKSKNIEELNSPRNIIIYAGDLHSTVYRNFLSQHGFIEIANSGYINRDPLNYETSLTNNIYACVSTRMFPMPFFNNIGQYSKLESLCKNIKILNYIDKSNYNTGLEYFILSLPGCVQDLSVGLMKTSWTRHGLEVRERTYYINYRYEPYDKGYNYIITETDFDTHTDEVNNENFIEKIINQVYGYFSNVEKETEFKIYFFALLTSVLLTNSDNEYNSQWYSDVKIMCEEMEEWIKLE